jgi:hypothetical protein
MTNDNQKNEIEALAKQLKQDLLDSYGPMLFGKALLNALGYGTGDAFRHAVSRGTVPVPIFSIAKRRGKYALTKDVADWIATQRITKTTNS